MNDSQIENSELSEFLNLFLHYFSIAHFFVKPIMGEKFPVIRKKRKAVNKDNPSKSSQNEEKFITLGMAHYNLLWLIDALLLETPGQSIEEIKVVELQQLKKVFIWYTEPEYRYVQRVMNMATDLYKTGHLERFAEHKTYYYISDKGRKLLEANRTKRKMSLAKLFKIVGNNKEIHSDIEKIYPEILEISKKITSALWENIIKESEILEIPQKTKD